MPKTEPFEKYSDVYDEWFHKNRRKYEAELLAIRQLIPSTDTEGMEVGVGSGKFAVPLGIKVGVEPSGKMAVKAKKAGINVYPGVAENLPFPDGMFDFVVLITTICFVDDVIRSFMEVFRVLKPGGCVITGFVDKESKLGKRYMKNRENSRFYREATFYSTKEVLELLEDTGFRSVTIKQTLVPGAPQGTILDGFGKGAFVAVKGIKQNCRP